MSTAQIITKQGFLSDDFIAQLACKKLDYTMNELEKIVGRYAKGKRKGQLKGLLTWQKCIRGGWKSESRSTVSGSGSGYVVYPNTTWGYNIVDNSHTPIYPDTETMRIIRRRRYSENPVEIDNQIQEYENKISESRKLIDSLNNILNTHENLTIKDKSGLNKSIEDIKNTIEKNQNILNEYIEYYK